MLIKSYLHQVWVFKGLDEEDDEDRSELETMEQIKNNSERGKLED